MRSPRVLVVAGLDPSGGAGLTADLAVLGCAGVRGVAAATAITLQGAAGVERVVPTDGDLVARTICSLAAQGPIDAVKVGMLATRAVVEAVDESLRRIVHGPVVLDPVLASGTGFPLLSHEGLEALVGRVFPSVDVLTPNLDEALRLTGRDSAARHDLGAIAAGLRALGPRAFLLKGGHLDGNPDDLWLDDAGPVTLPGRRIGAGRLHGGGCALSSWLAAGLALGLAPVAAARRAKAEVAAGIERAEVHPNGVRYLRWT